MSIKDGSGRDEGRNQMTLKILSLFALVGLAIGLLMLSSISGRPGLILVAIVVAGCSLLLSRRAGLVRVSPGVVSQILTPIVILVVGLLVATNEWSPSLELVAGLSYGAFVSIALGIQYRRALPKSPSPPDQGP